MANINPKPNDVIFTICFCESERMTTRIIREEVENMLVRWIIRSPMCRWIACVRWKIAPVNWGDSISFFLLLLWLLMMLTFVLWGRNVSISRYIYPSIMSIQVQCYFSFVTLWDHTKTICQLLCYFMVALELQRYQHMDQSSSNSEDNFAGNSMHYLYWQLTHLARLNA